jgi:hypothetical protein
MNSCGGSTTTTTTNACRSCYDADDDDDETDLTTTTSSNGTPTAEESSFCGVAAAALLDDLVEALLLENVTLRHENVEWRDENIELRIDNIALRRDLDEMRIELDRWEKMVTAAVFANRRRYRPIQFIQTSATTTKRRQWIQRHQQSGGANGGGGKAQNEAQEVDAQQQEAREKAGEKGDEVVVVDHGIIYEAYTDRDMVHHHGTIDFAMDGTKDLVDLLECDIVMNGSRYSLIRDDRHDLWAKAQQQTPPRRDGGGPSVPTTRRFGFVFGATKTTPNNSDNHHDHNHNRNGTGGGDRWYLEFTVLTTQTTTSGASLRTVRRVCSDPTVMMPELEPDRGVDEATRNNKALELIKEQGEEKYTTMNLARPPVGRRGHYYVTHVHGQQKQHGDFGATQYLS